MKNVRVLLASRPDGWPTEANFRLDETPVPEPREGEILVKSHWLSLDPYMRGRMNDAKSSAAKGERGEGMVGGGVGEVGASRNAAFAVGSFVVGPFGWQLYVTSSG